LCKYGNEKDEEDDDEDQDEDGDDNGSWDSDNDRDGDKDDDEDGDEDGGSRKSRKTGRQRPDLSLTTPPANQSMRDLIRSVKEKDKYWRESAPYDEHVPFSHRKGYTYAETTANQQMASWQAYRK